MKKGPILIIAIILIATIVVYLTHLNRSTGVPIHRHNEIYNILKSDTLSTNIDGPKNYTQPFKKYSLIDDEDEINVSLPDSLSIIIQNSNNQIEQKEVEQDWFAPE